MNTEKVVVFSLSVNADAADAVGHELRKSAYCFTRSAVLEVQKHKEPDDFTQFDEAAAIAAGRADPLLEAAKVIVQDAQYASLSLLQRRLKIMFGRSHRLLLALKADGVIVPRENTGRYIVVPPA